MFWGIYIGNIWFISGLGRIWTANSRFDSGGCANLFGRLENVMCQESGVNVSWRLGWGNWGIPPFLDNAIREHPAYFGKTWTWIMHRTCDLVLRPYAEGIIWWVHMVYRIPKEGWSFHLGVETLEPSFWQMVSILHDTLGCKIFWLGDYGYAGWLLQIMV